MSGHSKFANIKHKKAAADSKRGKLFTKLGKEIMVATKLGGKDIGFNPRLRLAISNAKVANMPKDNIEKAIKKGAGEIDGATYVDVKYEGYGPFGIAIIVNALTDNKNRTASDVRHAFNKYGGSLGETNSVSWMFDKKGIIVLKKDIVSEEEIFNIALEAGADDVVVEDEYYTIFTDPNLLYEIEDKIKFDKESVEISLIPQNSVSLEGEELEKAEKMLERLDDLDDVQDRYSNLEV